MKTAQLPPVRVEPATIDAAPVEVARIDAAPIAPDIPAVAPRVEKPAVTKPAKPPTTVSPRRTRAAAHAPSFLRNEARAAHSALPASWPRIAILAALALLLALQLLLAQRDVLARDARWRPAVDLACRALRCTLPPWRDPAAFTMLARDVRPHPTAPGTLQIAASFRNDARWAQAWPRLVLTLSDVDGRVVGARAFTAREYLGAPPTQNTLAPGQTAAISLSVVEPAPGVVSFGFEFR